MIEIIKLADKQYDEVAIDNEDGCKAMTIPHMEVRPRWSENQWLHECIHIHNL